MVWSIDLYKNLPISLTVKRIILLVTFLFSFNLLAASYQGLYCSLNFFNDKSFHKVLQHTVIETDINTAKYFPTTYSPNLKTVQVGGKDPFIKKVKDKLKDVWLRMIKSPQADKIIRRVMLKMKDLIRHLLTPLRILL